MKIVYDYQAFSRQFYGGVSRYFVKIAGRLSGFEGVQLQVLAPLYINQYLKDLDPKVVYGRQIASFPKAIGRIINVYNRPATRRQINAFKPDILHETYFSKSSAALKRGQVRIVTVHDMIHELFPQYFPAWDRTSASKRRAVERADHVICVSEHTRRDLLRIFDVPSSKVSVVYQGSDAQLVAGCAVTRPVEEPYLLYVGVRSAYKNFARLLQAYACTDLCKQFRLVCFGGGPFTILERQLFKQLGIGADRVVWKSGGDSFLAALYQCAVGFVYPSLYEGFGIPPLEAMANGCPVICSRGSSISEVVGSAGEFFDPRDSASIANAIEAVVNSKARADELRFLGGVRVRLFTWEQCAKQTYGIYSSLL